jgi:F-type H+-transporting ATPase subunit alpha
VASSASDSLGTLYLTPYSAMTLAEYFRDTGKDTLVILDDLTTHAKYYREVSLISKKFPGREAYPGDIFYSHARLLERAGLFKIGDKSVSITCLPVAETVEGDISGYIQTNLMSITDGHIFFDSELFKKGQKPAVNHFLSVTRVGRQTQSKLRWGVNRELVSFFTLLNKTQNFVHFGAELNEGIKSTLQMGGRLLSFFNQPIKEIVPMKIQIFFYCLVWIGVFNNDETEKMQELFLNCVRSYKSNGEFTKKIDELVVETDEFNMLLGKMSSKAAELTGYVRKLNANK